MPSCFFIGHREANESLLPEIRDAAEKLIRDNSVTEFYVGGYGAFDRLSGKAVLDLKAQYPNVHLYRVIPYHPAERPIEAPKGYDGTFYPEGMESVPRKVAIPRANRIMIDASDFLIAYVWHGFSNAAELLEYAKKRENRGLIKIINLGEKPIWNSDFL